MHCPATLRPLRSFPTRRSSDLATLLQIVVAPSVKLTVPPVGVAVPGATGLTVAVKVTLWPNTEGLPLVTTLVVVPSWFTVWATEPFDPLKLARSEEHTSELQSRGLLVCRLQPA